MEIERFKTQEGVEAVYQHIKGVNGVVFELHFQAGGINDPKGKAGLAHFCEHAFMGFSTDKHTREERREEGRKFQKINAFTSTFNMVFWVATTHDKLDEAVDHLTEGFECIKFSQENFDSEQKIIYDEFRTLRQSNSHLLSFIWGRQMSADPRENNIEYSLTGSEESLKNITLQDVENFAHDYLNLENLIINASGAIKKKDIERVVKKYIAPRVYKSGKIGMTRGQHLGYHSRPTYIYSSSLEKGKGLLNIVYQLEQGESVDFYKREETVLHRLINKVLHANAKKFFRHNKELCYGCSAGISRSDNSIFFEFNIQCQQENIEKVLEEFPEFLKTLIREFTLERFENARQTTLECYKFDVSTIWDRAEANIVAIKKYGSLLGNSQKDEDEFFLKACKAVKYQDALAELEKIKKVKPSIIIISDDKKFENFDYKKYRKKIILK